MKLIWKPDAKAEVVELVAYIRSHHERAAYRVAGDIVRQTEMLVTFPEMGRVGRVPGTRELVISRTQYIVVYRIGEETIEILSVFHGSREWPTSFG